MPIDLVSLLVILTVGLITPGPDMMIVLKNSLGGRARGMATVAGIALGLGLQTALLATAFTLLAAQVEAISEVLRWGGACVLLYIGGRALLSRSDAHLPRDGAAAAAASRSAFAEGLACNLTNPKAFLFFSGVFSQMIAPDSPAWFPIALPLIITVHGAVCWTILSSLVQTRQVAGRLERAQSVLVRIFGALLVVFGIGLLFWRR